MPDPGGEEVFSVLLGEGRAKIFVDSPLLRQFRINFALSATVPVQGATMLVQSLLDLRILNAQVGVLGLDLLHHQLDVV